MTRARDEYWSCYARISDCGQYRYRLVRRWGRGAPAMTFIMLNPSTADGEEDDPTIRRCVGFAKREGCSGIVVVNLFAYRATSPAELSKIQDPIGDRNENHLCVAATHARVSGGPCVAAWGANPIAQDPGKKVWGLFAPSPGLKCFGLTQSGAPRHPLYVPKDAPLQEYPF